ncbi:cupin domain-containing protein [Trinickia caryophylli]|uniref:cupin domain-containing protein n=1 Tax=Trinickia caryophylli TaxID=28094 RepID=UPI000A1556CE|nr:cupin domain-containing protein [Trinickia caryophylli]PMS12403.1 anti-sigma factor [Trinickia caryophylli]TRX20157.1 anti-sigma factor [Trinickia caryophylli]WQE13830.1 cupin domain-containing protein [Trinickia caryophylli]
MLVNTDFSRWAIVTPREYRWIASPQKGVERVMLERVGTEEARATSIVRYLPHSHFPQHNHPEGEEVLVLSGVFSEGDTHYPAGWYLRNPPGSSHRPSSEEGAVIFVKLRQMLPDERRSVRIDTRHPASWRRSHGQDVCLLFSNDLEHVCLRRLAPGEIVLPDSRRRTELLVLAGEALIGAASYGRGSWIRSPRGAQPMISAGARGATLYLKTTEVVDQELGA